MALMILLLFALLAWIALTRFIHEGMRKRLPRQFLEAEKSTSWAERRWKKFGSGISGQ
jgi:hypothetical protein